MNQGPDFQPRPDDEGPDPLLGALRQRLGERFGQEPPPELWASIRQQLPAATARPWWLRSRRLLALLALVGGVLLGGGIAMWRAGTPTPAARLAYRPATAPSATQPGKHPPTLTGTSSSGGLPTVARPPLASISSSSAAKYPVSTSPQRRAAPPPMLQRSRQMSSPASPRHRTTSDADAPLALSKSAETAAAAIAATKPGSRHELAARSRRWPPRYLTVRRPAAATTTSRQRFAAGQSAQPIRQPTAGRRPTTSRTAALPTLGQLNSTVSVRDALGQPAITSLVVSPATRPASRNAATAIRGTRPAGARAAEVALAPASKRRHRVAAAERGAPGVIATQLPLGANASTAALAAAVPPTAPAPLAVRPASLLLKALALPAPLAARPDSAGPWLPAARRWSVLALAGPTLSYRTTGQVFTTPQSYATSSAPATTVGAASPANLVASERPGLGWGAQVQGRRVLTGRWALALGAGYQEYAAQLTTQVSIARTAYANALDSALTLNHRETYRFFTLPVQLSYALGPPRGHLSLGLLGGLEPSWYQGGSTTLLTGTAARTLSFAAAAGSPYRSFSLAFSLGLDARYQLGGPASRWQLVVQPTARYLATPFVRDNAAGYTTRQPYSFGLLTGVAWQLR